MVKRSAATAGKKTRIGNRAKALIIGGCTAALVAGGSLAYFTDFDIVQNDFQVADSLDIKVVEPSWDPDNAKGLVPLATVAKDPAIQNVSGVPAWIVAQVEVPVADVTVVGENGGTEEVMNAELFTYALNTDAWTESGSPKIQTGYAVHTYLAKASVPVGEKTPNLFDQVQLINLVEGQLTGDDLNQQINVIGYGVQKEGFSNAADAWEAYRNQYKAV